MPHREVANKKEAYADLVLFLGEETAKALIGGIAKDLSEGNKAVIPLQDGEWLTFTGPTKEKKAKQRRRMYALRSKRGKKKGNKSTKGGKNA